VKLLRAATLTVADPDASARCYAEWFGYRVVEQGRIDANLAASWGAPQTAGCRCIVLRPSSGADVFLRFIEGEAPEPLVPLRTFGWAALEICVQDVLAVNERLRISPFEIIGPPREIEGLPSIFPMQVRGPDQEIVYLTQIRADLPSYDLPRAASPIDKLFILVLACSDLDASLAWFERHARLELGRKMNIVYTMLAKSFGLPLDDLHEIATMVHGRDVFLELDQYPAAATPRTTRSGELPAGIGVATLMHPEFDSLEGPWIEPPAAREGAVYGGRRAGTLRAPDGTLVEMVAAESASLC
jgi:catechol 2,3-dioxygenase-like lactoylglutathione lyase family enzyme